MLSINEIYEKGTELLAQEQDALEATKVGVLRGGSTGALLYGTTPIGNCARKAYLRYKGLSYEDIEDNRRLMFDAGLSNEDIWAKILMKALPEGYKLLREEEVPIKWALKDGTPVTGRPDLVVTRPDGSYEVGIELKLVSALWTAKDILAEDKPKLVHMLQAGHYAKQLGCEWELWYTSRVDFTVSREPWMQKLFTKIGPEHVEIRTQENKKTGRQESFINKIFPFRRGYRLWWSKDQLLYRRVDLDEKPRYSIITWDAIEAFYSTVAAIDTKGLLPPRPKNVDIKGEEAGYNMCDSKYCTLSATCDKYEANLKKWLAAIQLIQK